jgi:(p)ppGpp synthase/HD superfamily hydrolase
MLIPSKVLAKELLARSIAVAAEAFKDKVDKSGEPYILHCLRVMEKQTTDERRIIAVLHDLLEDTSWTSQDLLDAGFPDFIVYRISLLTHDKSMSYEDYIKRISMDLDATAIKLADLEDNSQITRLKGLTKKDFDRMEKYHKAYTYLSKT